MPGKIENLYALQEPDIAKAGTMLADAFEHDPVWGRIMEGCNREQRNAWFQSPVRYCMKYGTALATSPRIEGFTGWLPGEYSEMTFGRMLKSGATRSGKKAGYKPMFRMMPLRIFDKDRKKHMQDKPFIYVMIVGVSPEHQSQGFGGKLIRRVISESKKTGLPVYLETSTESNAAMYKHLGFKILDEIILPKFNIPQWEMLHEPK